MNLCICTLIRNEHNYIEEWIEYHHNLGFNKFYLFEDFNSISHKDLLSKYDFVELYRIDELANDEENNMFKTYMKQYIMFCIFNRLFRNKHDWMAFIDVDEFIDIDKNKLETILNKSLDKPMITMIWKNMESEDHIYHPNNWQKYSLLDTYKNYNFIITGIKQLINCNKKFDNFWNTKYWRMNVPHFIDTEYNDIKDNIYIKHFLCKSFEEFINKCELLKTTKYKFDNAEVDMRHIHDWFLSNPKYLKDEDKIIKNFNYNKYYKYKYNE